MANAKQLQAIVEAILFSAGEPLEISRISQAIDVEDELTQQILMNLGAELDERNSGICLLKLGDKYQLSTRSKYGDYITADGRLAWLDLDREAGDYLDERGVIIDFGENCLVIDGIICKKL